MPAKRPSDRAVIICAAVPAEISNADDSTGIAGTSIAHIPDITVLAYSVVSAITVERGLDFMGDETERGMVRYGSLVMGFRGETSISLCRLAGGLPP
jgi:hypothetical protein